MISQFQPTYGGQLDAQHTLVSPCVLRLDAWTENTVDKPMTAKTGIISSCRMLLGMALFAAPYHSDSAYTSHPFEEMPRDLSVADGTSSQRPGTQRR